MSIRTTLLALGALSLISMGGTARSAVLYDSGAPNGSITGVNIGYDTQVADSFILSEAATVTGINFTSWDYPNSSLTGVGYTIESAPTVPATLSNAKITSSTYLFTQSPNGYFIDENSFSTAPTSLASGTYYLVLGSATGNGGGFWDENNGSSTSYGPFGQYAGTSEAFQVIGTAVSAAPEPSTWLLMLAGIGSIGVMLRHAKKKMGLRSKDAFAA